MSLLNEEQHRFLVDGDGNQSDRAFAALTLLGAILKDETGRGGYGIRAGKYRIVAVHDDGDIAQTLKDCGI